MTKQNNLPSFFRALFLEPENLSKKSRIITLVICAAVIVGIFVAMYYNNMAYGQDDDTEVTILEDELAAEEMSDMGLDAEDEALINEELGMEDVTELDEGGDILPGDVDNFQTIPEGNEDLPPATESGAGLNDGNFVSIFDGKTLNGWKMAGDGRFVIIESDAALQSDKGGGVAVVF